MVHSCIRLRRLFFLAAISLIAARSEAETLDEIIAKNTGAMGGKQAIEAVQSVAVGPARFSKL